MEDIIITVLALAAGLIFKVIEKNLKSAGKPKPKQLTEMFAPEESEVFPTIVPEEDDVLKTDDVLEPVPVVEPVVSEKPRFVGEEEASRTVFPVNDQILVEELDRKKEKVDPKKLVVYSEIMKPKYLE